jgi:phosphoserine phosphatase RsbU/P
MDILIAAEDTPSRAELRRLLEELGHWAVACNDGAHAWDTCLTVVFPLIIADRTLKGISGIGLCRAIRAADWRPRRSVIIIGAGNSRADIEEALEAGADGYIAKPVKKEDLRAQLSLITGTIGRAANF